MIDGPFAETKELIAGYWIWQVRSMEEAVEWLKRCPNPMAGERGRDPAGVRNDGFRGELHARDYGSRKSGCGNKSRQRNEFEFRVD